MRLDEHRWVEVMDGGAAARGQVNQPGISQCGNMLRYGLSAQAVVSVDQTDAQFEQGLIISSRKLLDHSETDRIAQSSEDRIHVRQISNFMVANQ